MKRKTYEGPVCSFNQTSLFHCSTTTSQLTHPSFPLSPAIRTHPRLASTNTDRRQRSRPRKDRQTFTPGDAWQGDADGDERRRIGGWTFMIFGAPQISCFVLFFPSFLDRDEEFECWRGQCIYDMNDMVRVTFVLRIDANLGSGLYSGYSIGCIYSGNNKHGEAEADEMRACTCVTSLLM